MSMSKPPTMFDSIRLILLLAVIFLLSLLGTNIIGAPIITALAYFIVQYRRRIRVLENRLSDAGTSAAQGSTPPPPEPPAPPTSTDA